MRRYSECALEPVLQIDVRQAPVPRGEAVQPPAADEFRHAVFRPSSRPCRHPKRSLRINPCRIAAARASASSILARFFAT